MGRPLLTLRDCIQERGCGGHGCDGCPFNVFDSDSFGCGLRDGGGFLALAEELATAFERPELAQTLRGAFRRFDDHERQYEVLSLELVADLHATLVALRLALTNLSMTDEQASSLAMVSALEYYFRRASELRRPIEYGKFT